jgi:hypothetical protein
MIFSFQAIFASPGQPVKYLRDRVPQKFKELRIKLPHLLSIFERKKISICCGVEKLDNFLEKGCSSFLIKIEGDLDKYLDTEKYKNWGNLEEDVVKEMNDYLSKARVERDLKRIEGFLSIENQESLDPDDFNFFIETQIEVVRLRRRLRDIQKEYNEKAMHLILKIRQKRRDLSREIDGPYSKRRRVGL